MKKRYLFVLICFFSVIKIFSSDLYLNKKFYHTDEYATICISNTSIEFTNRSEVGKLVHKNMFDCFHGNETNYVILECTVEQSYFLTLVKQNHLEKYVYGKGELTYGKTKREAIYDSVKLLPFTVIKAESYITEKDKSGKEIRFLPEEFNFFSLGSNPWAVKKDDTKIIYLSTERWRHPTTEYYPVSDIVFVNGFVYPDKDYLYEQNSRAKRVRISYDKTSFEAELQDTGNFQVVHLPAAIDPKAKNYIKLEILDYYPGTKYSDIVISGVYYMDAVLEKKKN